MSKRLALVGLSALAAASGGAATGQATQFAVSPLSADHVVAVGEVERGFLEVMNTGDDWAEFRVAMHDFTTGEDGVDQWAVPGSHPRSLARWLSVSPSYLTLPPGGKGVVTYEFGVPAPAEGEPLPDGSYWGAIKVEGDRVRAGAESETPPATGVEVGIRVRFVFAIKIYAEIAGTARPGLEAVTLVALEDEPGLVASFANTGNVILRPLVWLEVRDAAGEVLRVLDALRVTIQPGTTRRFAFALSALDQPLPDGDYHAVVLADWGGPQLVGLQGPMRLVEEAPAPEGPGAQGQD